jgi:2'-5' RNA ligase
MKSANDNRSVRASPSGADLPGRGVGRSGRAAYDRAMPRLFVAIDPPDEQKALLAGLCSGLPGARWVRDRQFHLTLHFFGNVDGPTARVIGEALHGVRADPFELALRGVGHFPPRGEPRVLWAGVEESEGLAELHRQIQRVLRRVGLPPEERKFFAHVTLARLVGTPLPRLLAFLREHVELTAEPFAVTEFDLYSSVLASEGALHQREASYPLFA